MKTIEMKHPLAAGTIGVPEKSVPAWEASGWEAVPQTKKTTGKKETE